MTFPHKRSGNTEANVPASTRGTTPRRTERDEPEHHELYGIDKPLTIGPDVGRDRLPPQSADGGTILTLPLH